MSCDLIPAHVNPVSTTLPHQVFFELVMMVFVLPGNLPTRVRLDSCQCDCHRPIYSTMKVPTLVLSCVVIILICFCEFLT